MHMHERERERIGSYRSGLYCGSFVKGDGKRGRMIRGYTEIA
jgi:hypothetical protein